MFDDAKLRPPSLHPLPEGMIVVLRGQSQYGVLSHQTDCMIHELSLIGAKRYLIPLDWEHWTSGINNLLRDYTVPCFLSYQLWGADIKGAGGRSLFDIVRVPLVTILGDHPLYQSGRLENNIQHLVLFCCDDAHVAFLRQRMPAKVVRRQRLHFSHMPWSVVPPLAKREFDVVFPGSWGGYEEASQALQHENRVLRAVLLESVDRMMSQDDCAVHEAVDQSLARRGIDPLRVGFPKYCALAQTVDRFIRLERRLRALSSIKRARVLLMGNGWDKFPAKSDNLTIVPEGYPTGEALYLRSKIILNVLPGFTGGINDRPLMALTHGALCVTDGNPFMRRLLPENKGVRQYRQDATDIDDQIEAAQASLEEEEEALRSTADRLARTYTRDAYYAELFDGMESLKLSQVLR